MRVLELFSAETIAPDLSGLPSDRFNSAWRAVTRVEPCSISEVEGFVLRHYLGKRPAIITLCLKVVMRGLSVGMIVFAMPPRESSKRYGGETWELARLWLLDCIPRNAETWVIGQAVRYVKRHYQSVSFLLSYADPAAGHSGTIYKAANWQADGRTDDERKSPRCDYVDDAGKRYGRAGNVPDAARASVVRVPRSSKHRFILNLNSNMPSAPSFAQALGQQRTPRLPRRRVAGRPHSSEAPPH